MAVLEALSTGLEEVTNGFASRLRAWNASAAAYRLSFLAASLRYSPWLGASLDLITAYAPRTHRRSCWQCFSLAMRYLPALVILPWVEFVDHAWGRNASQEG
jgi:hypothetical protein